MFSMIPGAVHWKVGIDMVADVTVAVLEETLHSMPQRTAVISNVISRYPQIGHFEEEF